MTEPGSLTLASAPPHAGTAEPFPPAATAPPCLDNPVVESGADPWILYHEGWYYFTSTEGDRIDIRKSRTLAGLRQADPVTIWKAPARGPHSRDIWAPEFHWVEGRWYVYFTATDHHGTDARRRVFVLESITGNLQGDFVERGPLRFWREDHYAIDGSLLQQDGQLYFFWSGREHSAGGPQNLYVAPMADPVTLSGRRVLLSRPEFGWERHGWAVNEAPQLLARKEGLFLVYSASGFTTPHYCLGMLRHRGGNPLDARSWEKSPEPVFGSCPQAGVYGPGHNSFFLSPDGTQDWILYHARNHPGHSPSGRTARAQPFGWCEQERPRFGRPVASSVPMPPPSGEAAFLRLHPV